ncbi:MAG: 2-C-methyl-D-erythritol 4-phosphate cytidylyltransferase [Acidobacteria bacterium]|nr:2-C-methyl-D-erythritol 4-phosphate cytidylyltransferase [Acidobacteriota bacterium]
MNVAIIPAAGSGARFGGQIPKQFIEISGVPILAHTIKRFVDCSVIGAIVVALPEDRLNEFPRSLQDSGWCRLSDERPGEGLIDGKKIFFVPGGAERSDSIRNALQVVENLQPGIVAVHDAVRPLVTSEQISAVIEKAEETGAAILALPATDTIKEVENGLVVRTIDRRRIWRAQTPQAFRYGLLMEANLEARVSSLPPAMTTDDSLLVERLGAAVAVVEGSVSNLKITTPEDLVMAQKLFEQHADLYGFKSS